MTRDPLDVTWNLRAIQDELFRLECIRALVREWPEDTVPVIPISELARILEGG